MFFATAKHKKRKKKNSAPIYLLKTKYQSFKIRGGVFQNNHCKVRGFFLLEQIGMVKGLKIDCKTFFFPNFCTSN